MASAVQLACKPLICRHIRKLNKKIFLFGSRRYHHYDSHSSQNRSLSFYGATFSISCSKHGTNIAVQDFQQLRNIRNYSSLTQNAFHLKSSSVLYNDTPKRNVSLHWLDSLAITQVGWFRALAQSPFIENVMGVLQGIHDTTHLPWYASIILSTILLRGCITFPLAVYQNYILAKVENLKPEMDELVEELKRETAYAVQKFGWDKKQTHYMFNRSVRKMYKELIIRDNCHPFKASLLIWIQIPLWVSVSMSLRNMASMLPRQDMSAQILFLELSTGGFGWIPNLTEVDHSLIIPVALGITNLLITEVNILTKVREDSRMRKIATNVFRGLSILMIPIAATVPSCVSLYWLTSSVCGLFQNLILMHPQIQQKCGIPAYPSQLAHPYQQLLINLKLRFTRKKDLSKE